MSRKARRLKLGSHLDPMDADKLLDDNESDLGKLDRQLCAAGYRRAPTVRPYLTKRGIVTLRFVWRRRLDGATSVYQHVIRFPISDVLSEA